MTNTNVNDLSTISGSLTYTDIGDGINHNHSCGFNSGYKGNGYVEICKYYHRVIAARDSGEPVTFLTGKPVIVSSVNLLSHKNAAGESADVPNFTDSN